MVDHEKQRARYVAGSEGAPPVPPPGGYRGARRAQTPYDPRAAASAPASVVIEAEPKQPANALGWIALIGAILFALILLGALFAGGTGVIYGVTMLALQLVLVAVVIAALVTKRGRMLGAAALAVALVLNVGTVGAMSAVHTSASGNYQGMKTDKQKHEEAYPGIKGTDPRDILGQSSLEKVRAQSETLMADVRERLTDEFGYTWVQVTDEDVSPERNGYGGESMLVGFTSPVWATNEPIQDYERKLEVMDVIDEVILEHGLWDLYPFNEPGTGLEDDTLVKFYGSDDPREQHTWEYYSENYPEPLRFYANVYDLSKDTDGGFLKQREAEHARTGAPLEGLQILVHARELLSEADRAEFEKKLEEYPGF